MRAIALTLIPIALFFYATKSYADANDGALFGYTLGERYAAQQDETPAGGQLLLIETRESIKPRSIDKVYVLLTPVTRSIGKIAGETWYASGEDAVVEYERFRLVLRNKYSDWDSEERTDQTYHTSVFSDGTHELILQVSGPHSVDVAPSPSRLFQFIVTLVYQPQTQKAAAFDAMADREIKASAADKYSGDDLQGL